MKNEFFERPDGSIGIVLCGGKIAIIDPESLPLVLPYPLWGPRQAHGLCYCGAYESGKNVKMHHLVVHPVLGMEIDHANRDGLDNRRGNLRLCTRAQNMANRRFPVHSSIYKGVSWSRTAKRWRANIGATGHRQHIGYFSAEADAALAYNDAALSIWGKFARCNIVSA